MKIEQIYTGCLAQGAYYIVSEGEAAIIDPLRETKPYLERLERDGVQLKYIFETHFHADFVSGHIDLSKATGAPIVYGPGAETGFPCINAIDGQLFHIGDICIEALHTPGHTPESTSWLLRNAEGKAHALFSGDTLFIGDVGRPDLAQNTAHLSQEQMASMLFKSLRSKIMPLPDDVLVYPAHGAGSACGKNMRKETYDTLGNQKATNYALRADMSEQEFVKELTDGLLPPPGYFGANVQMNKLGYQPLQSILTRSLQALHPNEFEHIAKKHRAIILDTRPAATFYQGHIPGAINIGLNGDFAPWAGVMLVDVQQPLLLVSEPGTEQEAITRLSRVGFDEVLGYLAHGYANWVAHGKPVDTVARISAEAFAEAYQKDNITVLDVRKANEYNNGHVQRSTNIPLADLPQAIHSLAEKEPFYLHCAGGYRSMIAASLLKARGIHYFYEVDGGYAAIQKVLAPVQMAAVDGLCTNP